MCATEIDWEKLSEIIKRYKDKKWGLIPLLQEVQQAFGYIPRQTIEPIANGLNIYPSQIQGVITFYAGFSLQPKGKCVLKVCKGTACHVKGGQNMLKLIKRELKLEEGETSEDYKFTLETVACLGACFLAPALMANVEYFGRLSPNKISSLLEQYGKDKGEE